MKAITKRLRVLRAVRGWSQIETAHRSGIKEYRYWRIESGYSTPTHQEVKALARVLETSTEELFPDAGLLAAAKVS